MTLTEKVLQVKNSLHQTPIFQNIIDEQLQAVANIAILQTYKKNETLF
jgi:CRP/FNR family transcriptional regulator